MKDVVCRLEQACADVRIEYVVHDVGERGIPAWEIHLEQFDEQADPRAQQEGDPDRRPVLPRAVLCRPRVHCEAERDEAEDVDEHIVPEGTVVFLVPPRRHQYPLRRCAEHGRDDKVAARVGAAPAYRSASFGKIVVDEGGPSRGFDLEGGKRDRVEGKGEQVPAPGISAGGGVPEQDPRRPPSVRQEREVNTGSSPCRFPVDEQGQTTILRTHDDGPLDILLQSTGAGLPIPIMEGSFPFEDPEDQFIPPLGKEEQLAPFVVVRGQDSRDGTGRFLAGDYVHLDGEGPGQIDGAPGREKRFLAAHDPVFVEPQAGLPFDPVDVVGRTESKRPQSHEEKSEGKNDADGCR